MALCGWRPLGEMKSSGPVLVVPVSAAPLAFQVAAPGAYQVEQIPKLEAVVQVWGMEPGIHQRGRHEVEMVGVALGSWTLGFE